MKLLRRLPLVLLLVLSFQSQAQEEKAYQGLLWRISGNGLEAPSHLYGTMHVSDKLAYHLSDSLFQAIEECDVVALETDPSEWMEAMGGFDRFPSLTDYLSHQALMQAWNEGSFYENAFRLKTPDRERLSRAIAQDNRMTDRFLFRTQDHRGDFQENTYLDLFIFRGGKKSGKRIVSLEDLQETMELRNRANEEGGGMQGSIRYGGERQSVHELMRDAYREGDLQKLDSVVRLASPDAFIDLMIEKRNRIMAGSLDSLMRNGEEVVAAVGAAHLPGDTGMIEILRRKGYRLEPLERNFDKKSEKSKAFKNRVEEEYLESEWQAFHSPDSLFKGQTPGPMYSTLELPHHREQLHIDVSNGVFYQVRSIDTHSPLSGKSVEAYVERIDSLLFEFIPGEILERERIEVNGHPAFHILNETLRGNIQRYRIVVMPLRILIFKVGGTGELVKGAAGTRFFDELEFTQGPEKGWSSYRPGEGGFSVLLPTIPLRYEPRTTDMKKEERLKLQSLDPETEDYYLVMKRTLHDYEYIEEDSFELERLSRKFAENIDLETEEERIGSYKGYPSIDFKLSAPDEERELIARILIRGGEYYLLLAAMRSDADPARFLNSFSFEEFEHHRPFSEYQDTAFHFSTRTIHPDPVPEYSLSAQWRKAYEMWNSSSSNEFWYEEEKKFFGSYTPAQKIMVRTVRFKDLLRSMKDSIHLWNGTARRLYPEDMVLERRWIPEGSDSSEFQFLHTDTNSIRCIRSRNIYHEGMLFSILHYTDTLTEPSPFVARFMNDFEPKDSSFAPSVFEDKVKLFFEYVEGGDSAELAKAEEQFYLVDFEGDGERLLMDFIENTEPSNEDLKDLRRKAIRRLGDFHESDSSIFPFMRTLYENAENSADQLAVLRGLAYMENESSKELMLELFEHEIPLTSESYPIERLFTSLEDSLELSLPLIPGLFQLTDYEDYKIPVYELVAEMVDSGIVKGASYEEQKPFILRDARREMRKWAAFEAEREAADTVTFLHDGEEYSYEWWGDRDLPDRGQRLITLASLLIPFHGEDEKIDAFFAELGNRKDPALLKELSILRALHGLEVEDSLWTRFAVIDPFRVPLLRSLRAIGKEEHFPDAFRDAALISRGLLYGYRDPLEDSVEYLTEREVKVKGKRGLVHFFKSKSSYQEEWTLDYAGLQPLEKGALRTEGTFQERGVGVVSEREDPEEQIEELLDDIRVRGRDRAASSSPSFGHSIW